MWYLWVMIGFLIGFFVGIQPEISRPAEAMTISISEKLKKRSDKLKETRRG